jgi:hypothetical protein
MDGKTIRMAERFFSGLNRWNNYCLEFCGSYNTEFKKMEVAFVLQSGENDDGYHSS